MPGGEIINEAKTSPESIVTRVEELFVNQFIHDQCKLKTLNTAELKSELPFEITSKDQLKPIWSKFTKSAEKLEELTDEELDNVFVPGLYARFIQAEKTKPRCFTTLARPTNPIAFALDHRGLRKMYEQARLGNGLFDIYIGLGKSLQDYMGLKQQRSVGKLLIWYQDPNSGNESTTTPATYENFIKFARTEFKEEIAEQKFSGEIVKQLLATKVEYDVNKDSKMLEEEATENFKKILETTGLTLDEFLMLPEVLWTLNNSMVDVLTDGSLKPKIQEKMQELLNTHNHDENTKQLWKTNAEPIHKDKILAFLQTHDFTSNSAFNSRLFLLKQYGCEHLYLGCGKLPSGEEEFFTKNNQTGSIDTVLPKNAYKEIYVKVGAAPLHKEVEYDLDQIFSRAEQELDQIFLDVKPKF